MMMIIVVLLLLLLSFPLLFNDVGFINEWDPPNPRKACFGFKFKLGDKPGLVPEPMTRQDPNLCQII